MINKIKKIAEKYPNSIAYKIDNNMLTYKELWEKSLEYSDYLKRQDNQPIIIYGDKSIDFIISIISCILANRTYIPISKNIPTERIKSIIDITNSSLLLTNDIIEIDNISKHSLDELKQYKNNKIYENNNKIAYIINTSGSTGIPKGVPISYNNLNNFINWISSLYPLKQYQNINVLNQAHFNFDLSVADLYYSLCNGHTLISINNIENDYKQIFETLKEIDLCVITPTFAKLLLINPEFNEKNYKIKCLYFCGELLDVNTVKKIYEKFPRITIINAYGPTEATSAVSGIIINKNMLSQKLLPVGDMNHNATHIEIVNNEIVLKGDSVFEGYLGNIKGGYYQENNINCFKTGDIGYIENDMLYCKGRLDNQIKYKGYRIELNEIEYYINSIKEVNNCCVIPIYDNNIVKSIKAYIETSKEVETNYIISELTKKIPKYMIPKIIKIIPKLPLNNNGKIDRKALVNYDRCKTTTI